MEINKTEEQTKQPLPSKDELLKQAVLIITRYVMEVESVVDNESMTFAEDNFEEQKENPAIKIEEPKRRIITVIPNKYQALVQVHAKAQPFVNMVNEVLYGEPKSTIIH